MQAKNNTNDGEPKISTPTKRNQIDYKQSNGNFLQIKTESNFIAQNFFQHYRIK